VIDRAKDLKLTIHHLIIHEIATKRDLNSMKL
jgi:hypothetical protein